jgi:hypothetical protein
VNVRILAVQFLGLPKMPNPQGTVANLKKYQPGWQSGSTQTIRIPISLADRVLAYARELDQGSATAATLNHESLLQVIQKLEVILETPRNNFSREKKALLSSAITELKSLVTSDKIQNQ